MLPQLDKDTGCQAANPLRAVGSSNANSMKRNENDDKKTPESQHQMTLPTSKDIKSEVKTSKCYWEVLPFELREQIFSEFEENKWGRWWNNGPTAIVKALRTLPISYSHILQWFARHAVANLTDDPWQLTGLYFKDMDVNEVELKSIQYISIDPRYNIHYSHD